MKWRLVSVNVATLVDPPRAVRGEVRALSPADARAVLEATRGDWLKALYTLALAVGLRQGEALGLHWKDVDLEAGILRVRVALTRVEGVASRRLSRRLRVADGPSSCFSKL